MGLLSSSVSITRYRVEGKLEEPVLETMANGLKRHVISEIDGNVSDETIGWTSFENPFNPKFEGSSFVIGGYFVFSLRIDKKTIPRRVIKKHFDVEVAKQLMKTGAKQLSREEKRRIRQKVEDVLTLQIPATPNIYDVVWQYESSSLWFFSNLKSANEALETLFAKSFNLTLIRLFPFTMADLTAGLSPEERDRLTALSPTSFTE
nr:exonuclease [Desulfobacterales bacterium]